MMSQKWWLRGWLIVLTVLAGESVRAEEDPFPDPPEFIEGWGWAVDPDGTSSFRVDSGKLTIAAPGPVQDMSIELGRMNAPRTARKVVGDFIVQVKVDGRFAPGEEQGLRVRLPYHGAGLLLMNDFDTYFRMDRAAVTRDTAQQDYIAFQTWDQGKTVRPKGPWNASLKEQAAVYLRLERHGNVVLGAIASEPGKWHYLAPQTAPLPDAVWIGVSAVNVSGEKLEAQFEEFEILQPSKITKPKTDSAPEDLPPGADGTKLPKPIGGFPVAARVPH